MNDSAIKSYCIWARRELMSEVERRCAIYDISENPMSPADADAVNGLVLTGAEKAQRKELLGIVREEGYGQIVERAAYTWFNRIMAIRFMEVNDLLPSRTRMLSANDGSSKPQVLTEALSVDIEGLDRARVAELVQAGDDEATFRYLFLAQCYELSKCMPGVFEKVGASLEMLLPDGLLRSGGIIEHIVIDIEEADWAEGVEIIGWCYQYYNTELRAAYQEEKVGKHRIGPATCVYTPEWLVRYMVDNSLGRVWLASHPNSKVRNVMRYYVEPESKDEKLHNIQSPEEITVCDPACGSGHILVYAFELLYDMYEESGYHAREISRLILEKNLSGFEIDDRAVQFANFELTMKACEYDKRFLRHGIPPNITTLFSIDHKQDDLNRMSVSINGSQQVFDILMHLDEIGSLYRPASADIEIIDRCISSLDENSLLDAPILQQLKSLRATMRKLSQRYLCVIANPPYRNTNKMDPYLSAWIKQQYPHSKSDLFACFIERLLAFRQDDGVVSIASSNSWMFNSSYEKSRRKLLNNQTIATLVQMSVHGYEGIAAQVFACSFINKQPAGYRGGYIRLSDFDHYSLQGPKAYEAIADHSINWFYRTDSSLFEDIPGSPIAYWATQSTLTAFENGTLLCNVAKPRQGLSTADNNRFIRFWWEVSQDNIERHARCSEDAVLSNRRWYPCNKGGDYRKWYGNNENIVDWCHNGTALRDFEKSVIRNPKYYFLEGLTWGTLSSAKISMRISEPGAIHTDVGSFIYTGSKGADLSLLAFINSSVSDQILDITSVGLHFVQGPVGNLPLLESVFDNDQTSNIATENVEISKQDYASYETSPIFIKNSLIPDKIGEGHLFETYFKNWKNETEKNFDKLKANEERLNDIFAGIYGMQDEVPISVSDRYVSIARVFDSTNDIPASYYGNTYVRTKRDEIVAFISYAIGCIVGRYSLDKRGLVLANQGGELDEYLEQIPDPTFKPDEDGIIPLTDIEYFHDDATGLFVDFTRTAYGDAHLEENLKFIANALGGDETPRQIIRAYFRNDFFEDHCKTYRKRPIYWLFDSGKKGGFRALFYMHRYTPDLLARLRTEYVHPQQERYRTQLERIDDAMQTADKREQATLRKEHKKIAEQLAETNIYEEKVHHLADQMIEISLDDGVNHNYALFQDVLAKIK